MSFIDDIINFFVAPIRSVCPPAGCVPISTFTIIGAAFLVAFLTSSANRFLVDYKMVNSYRTEFNNWRMAVNKAKKEGDEKQLDKLMKRQSAMMRMSSRAQLEQLKTTAITFIPLLLIYYILLSAFPLSTAVAFSPVYLPGAAASNAVFKAGAAFVSMVYWYFLSNFTVSIPLSRIFGIQTYSLTPTSDKK